MVYISYVILSMELNNLYLGTDREYKWYSVTLSSLSLTPNISILSAPFLQM